MFIPLQRSNPIPHFSKFWRPFGSMVVVPSTPFEQTCREYQHHQYAVLCTEFSEHSQGSWMITSRFPSEMWLARSMNSRWKLVSKVRFTDAQDTYHNFEVSFFFILVHLACAIHSFTGKSKASALFSAVVGEYMALSSESNLFWEKYNFACTYTFM